jgi:predicted nuclease of restriction endonuclease-like (RecB) superfamily
MKKNSVQQYGKFFVEIKQRIKDAQYAALKAVNRGLISLYWDIGKMIVERQGKYGWGKAVVETLAKDLQKEFPGMHGFSAQNIWYMRQFYLEYSNNPKLQPLVGEISWTKHLVIMAGCKTVEERLFYVEMTKKFAWTKNVLALQIGNKAFAKYHNNQTNFAKTVSEKIFDQAKLAVKDEYTFDFLGLGEDHAETALERGLVDNIRKFLLEMGGYFCFVGNQYRLEIEGDEFFIDLLLYHRKLKCLVAVELKVGDFKPEYAGKMQFYLSALNHMVKLEDERPSIGIIICRNKKRTIVEYALEDVNKPIGVSTYTMKNDLPKRLERYLPSPEKFIKSLENF